MPPAFKAAGVIVTGGSGATLSPVPPAHVADDILVAVFVGTYNTSDIPPTPAGWTLIGQGNSTLGGVRANLAAYWKRATGSGEGAPALVTPATDPSCLAVVYSFENCLATADPVDAPVDTESTVYPGLDMSIAGSVTAEDNSLVVLVFGGYMGGGGANVAGGYANADLSAITEHRDSPVVVGGDQLGVALVSGLKASAGPYGATTATAGAAVYFSWGALAFALKPVPAAVVTDTPPASLGGIMTVLLLAQPGARRDRQVIYGPKWPMLRKRR